MCLGAKGLVALFHGCACMSGRVEEEMVEVVGWWRWWE